VLEYRLFTWDLKKKKKKLACIWYSSVSGSVTKLFAAGGARLKDSVLGAVERPALACFAQRWGEQQPLRVQGPQPLLHPSCTERGAVLGTADRGWQGDVGQGRTGQLPGRLMGQWRYLHI